MQLGAGPGLEPRHAPSPLSWGCSAWWRLGGGQGEQERPPNPAPKPPLRGSLGSFLRRPCLGPLHKLSSRTPEPSKGGPSGQAPWKSRLPGQFGLLPSGPDSAGPGTDPAWLRPSRPLLPGSPAQATVTAAADEGVPSLLQGQGPTLALSPQAHPLPLYSLLIKVLGTEMKGTPKMPLSPSAANSGLLKNKMHSPMEWNTPKAL